MPPGWKTNHFGWGPCRAHADEFVHDGWVVAVTMAREEQITPWDALLKSVRLAAGRVTWVDEQLDAAVRANDGDMAQPAVTRWLQESRLERTLMAKVSKAAIDGGVAERMVRQVELEGQLVAEAIVHALDVLDLTADQRAQALTAAHQRLLSAGDSQTATVHGTVLHDDSGRSRTTSGPPDHSTDHESPAGPDNPIHPDLEPDDGPGGSEGDNAD